MNSTDLDRVDYALLTAITDASEPVWKKRIHAYLQEHTDQLPITDAVSLQTVGRRIDQLYENGHIQSDIVSADGLNRDLIIGYTITADGHTLFDATGRALLKRYATGDEDLSQAAVISLISRHIPITPTTREQLDDVSADDLQTLIQLAYAREQLRQDRGQLDTDKLSTLFHALPPRQQDNPSV